MKNVVQRIFTEKLNYSIPNSKLLKVHRVGRKVSPPNIDKRSILIELPDNETKKDLIASSRRVRADGIYVQENLSPVRKSIMYVLRKAKRDFPNKVSGCASIDGNVYAWIKTGNTAGSRDIRMQVNDYVKLEKFCTEIISTSLNDYAPDLSN